MAGRRQVLDTYHAERHPIGERLMTLTRAQEALARPGDHVTALRELIGWFLQQEQTFRSIVEEITDVDICYEMAAGRDDRHPLLGRWAPNLALHAQIHVADLMRAGKPILVDLTERSAVRETVAPWTDRVEVTSARCYHRTAKLDAMLVRPDGYVAWILRPGDREEESERTLRAAMEGWSGCRMALNSPREGLADRQRLNGR
jgi:hypothetical protein